MSKSVSGDPPSVVSSLRVTSLAPNTITYGDGSGFITSVPPGANGQVLTAQLSGPPIFANISGATNAANLIAGFQGQIPVQSAPSTTTFIANTAGLLQATPPGLPVFTNTPICSSIKLTSLTASTLVYVDVGNNTASIPNGSVGQILTATTGTPSFQTAPAPNVSSVTGILPILNGGTGTNNTTGFFAGPTGAVGVPAFRAIVNADLPVIDLTTGEVTGILPIAQGGTGASTFADTNVLIGNVSGPPTVRALTASDISAVNATSINGTVQVSQGGTGVSSTTANFVFAAPDNTNGVPSFRALVNRDIPAINLNSAQVTNTLQIANGGTGAVSFAQNSSLMGPISGGPGTPTIRTIDVADITAVNATAISGTVQIAQGGTGASSFSPSNVLIGPVLGGVPTLRTLLKEDISQVNSSALTGQVAVAQGGTGANSFSASGILIGPAGSSGTPSIRALTASDISAVSSSALTGQVAVAQGGTGVSTTANHNCFLGPISGGPSEPSFRLIDASDIPAITLTSGVTGILPIPNGGTGSNSFANSTLLIGPTTGGPLQPTIRSLVASDLPSVPLTTGVTGILPVANGGTNTATAAANLVFATPDGSTGAPSFRAIVSEDLPGKVSWTPAVTKLSGGTLTSATYASQTGSYQTLKNVTTISARIDVTTAITGSAIQMYVALPATPQTNSIFVVFREDNTSQVLGQVTGGSNQFVLKSSTLGNFNFATGTNNYIVSFTITIFSS